MELTYDMRRELRREQGGHAAAVFDVLAHHDPGDAGGVEITARRLAAESGLSEKTVRRAVARLADAGLVESGNQFRDNRQVANCYHPRYDRLGVGPTDHPGGHGDQANTSTATHVEPVVVTDCDVVSNFRESVVQLRERSRGSEAGLRPAAGDPWPEEGPNTKAPGPPAIPWVPRNSPMPMPRRDGRFIGVHDHAMWLVSYFEGLVLERANKESVAEGRKSRDFIPDYRKEKWLGNAMELVHAHPLDEVVAVIDWLFTTCRGELPHLVVAERPDLMRPGDLKLTRLVQIQENYDGLVREMANL